MTSTENTEVCAHNDTEPEQIPVANMVECPYTTDEEAKAALEECACDCCDRHNKDKPTELGVWNELPPRNRIIDKVCPCDCRHTARWICRNSCGNAYPDSWGDLWATWNDWQALGELEREAIREGLETRQT